MAATPRMGWPSSVTGIGSEQHRSAGFMPMLRCAIFRRNDTEGSDGHASRDAVDVRQVGRRGRRALDRNCGVVWMHGSCGETEIGGRSLVQTGPGPGAGSVGVRSRR